MRLGGAPQEKWPIRNPGPSEAGAGSCDSETATRCRLDRRSARIDRGSVDSKFKNLNSSLPSTLGPIPAQRPRCGGCPLGLLRASAPVHHFKKCCVGNWSDSTRHNAQAERNRLFCLGKPRSTAVKQTKSFMIYRLKRCDSKNT